MTDWGSRLEAVRQRLGWTYRDLANFFAYSEGHVHNWTTGRRHVPIPVRGWIAQMEEAIRRQDTERQRRELAEFLLTVGVVGAGAYLINYLNRSEDSDEDER
jgi:transcriptional regulator with XRE-family HTH domain